MYMRWSAFSRRAAVSRLAEVAAAPTCVSEPFANWQALNQLDMASMAAA